MFVECSSRDRVVVTGWFLRIARVVMDVSTVLHQKASLRQECGNPQSTFAIRVFESAGMFI